MILSTGLDVCDIRRIEKILAGKTAMRFMQRYFTPAENAHIVARRDHARAAAYARRWAAKEAIAKALGTGFRGGLHMHQMEVLNDANGKPGVVLSGKAKELLSDLISPPPPQPSPTRGEGVFGRMRERFPLPLREGVRGRGNFSLPQIHLAMTDEYPYAMAQIIISG